MKNILFLCICISLLFSRNENESLLSKVKKIIQKEEYIALAVNKYIVQTGKLPKTAGKFDWSLLETEDYLGENFNRMNPLSKQDIGIYFGADNDIFLKSVVDNSLDVILPFTEKYKFLYNLYANKIYRVNTLVPKDITENNLEKGSSVVYPTLQKEIVSLLNDGELINTNIDKCEVNQYFYELKDTKLTYKYCKEEDSSGITVYQDSPVYAEDYNDLEYIKTKIDGKAYVKKGGLWFEYYYQGDTYSNNKENWIPISNNRVVLVEETDNIYDQIISYIPDSKDLLFRESGGCMLANGDIFCWGDNKNKKAGIETAGQIDKTLSPDYVNTPVMLRVQIDDDIQIQGLTRYDKRWYNNPYRVKFEKISMNSQNVCGISPIFTHTNDRNEDEKIGGDLYCNGKLNSKYFQDLDDGISTPEELEVGVLIKTSMLKRNKFLATGKTNILDEGTEIYIKDIAMVEDAGLVLSDVGDIYTFGKNYEGILGMGQDETFYTYAEPTKIEVPNTTFTKVFGLRDSRTFGAIDTNNVFWIWGRTKDGVFNNVPKIIQGTYDPDFIFVNTNQFILKDFNGNIYKTTGTNSLSVLPDIPSTAISVATFFDTEANGSYLYINETLELKGSATDLLKCRESSEEENCNTTDNKIFDKAFKELNDPINNDNGTYFANFSNVGIFKLDRVLDVENDTFKDSEEGWSMHKEEEEGTLPARFHNTSPDTGDTTQQALGSFLGPFPIGRRNYLHFDVWKEFSFPDYPNYDVELEFDFYKLSSWDAERFEVYANDELIAGDHFVFDNKFDFEVFGQEYIIPEINIPGEPLQDNVLDLRWTDEFGTVEWFRYPGFYDDEVYRYKLKAKTDENGLVRIKLRGVRLDSGPYYHAVQEDGSIFDHYWANVFENVGNEGWGIANLSVKVKEMNKKFVCGMTGFDTSSQMYCWGNIARSIPIMNTSLFDMSKIDTVNKVFLSEEVDISGTDGEYNVEGMAYDNFNSDGTLHLKFPTYIGGFDYQFNFK